MNIAVKEIYNLLNNPPVGDYQKRLPIKNLEIYEGHIIISEIVFDNLIQECGPLNNPVENYNVLCFIKGWINTGVNFLYYKLGILTFIKRDQSYIYKLHVYREKMQGLTSFG